jgi:hypothetical protein
VDLRCIYFSAKPVAQSFFMFFEACPLHDKKTDNTSKKKY